MGHHHLEQPRLNAINDRLIATGLEMVLHQYDAPIVERALLEAVHDTDYIDEIFAASPADGLAWIDGDTAMNPLFTACSAARSRRSRAGRRPGDAGQGQSRCSAPVRLPGHHAERHRAMGFCLSTTSRWVPTVWNHYGLQRVCHRRFRCPPRQRNRTSWRGMSVSFLLDVQHPFYPHNGFDSTAANVVNAPWRREATARRFATRSRPIGCPGWKTSRRAGVDFCRVRCPSGRMAGLGIWSTRITPG